jgi:hypothetical protein
MLRQCKALGSGAARILDLKSVPHAIAIAARPDLPHSVAARIAGYAPATSAGIDPAPDQPIAGRFLEAEAAERLQILAALEKLGPLATREWRTSIPAAILDRLEQAVLRREPSEFARLLEHSLDVPPPIAQRIVADPSGEPVLVLLRALAAPIETVSRILLLLNPDIGLSVQRVFALTKLYAPIAEPVAQYLAQLGGRRRGGRPSINRRSRSACRRPARRARGAHAGSFHAAARAAYAYAERPRALV